MWPTPIHEILQLYPLITDVDDIDPPMALVTYRYKKMQTLLAMIIGTDVVNLSPINHNVKCLTINCWVNSNSIKSNRKKGEKLATISAHIAFLLVLKLHISSSSDQPPVSTNISTRIIKQHSGLATNLTPNVTSK